MDNNRAESDTAIDTSAEPASCSAEEQVQNGSNFEQQRTVEQPDSDSNFDEQVLAPLVREFIRRQSQSLSRRKSVSFKFDADQTESDDIDEDPAEQLISDDELIMPTTNIITNEMSSSDPELAMTDISSDPIKKRLSKSGQSERRLSKRSKVLQLSLDETTGAWSTVARPRFHGIKKLSSMKVIRRHRNEPDFSLKAVVLLLFLVIVSTIIAVTILYRKQQQLISMDAQIFFWDEAREFDILNTDGKLALKVHYATNVPVDLAPTRCLSIDKDGYRNEICRDWKHRAHLDINYDEKDNNVSCYHIHWQGHSVNTVLRDCFELGNARWFGMGQVLGARWPLTNLSISTTAFVTSHNLDTDHPFGSIIKRYWISSKGAAIRVPLNVPLFISYNSTEMDPNGDGLLCFEARTQDYPYDAIEDRKPHLDYSLCTGRGFEIVHREMSRAWLKSTDSNPTDSTDRPPQQDFLEQLIWSTELLPELDQSTIIQFADSILEYGLAPGILLLDNRWERRHGELEFNSTRVPKPSALIQILKNKGFKIMLTLSPFVAIEANVLSECSRNRRVISDPHLDVPLLTQCFGGGSDHMCALLDMRNATTREWYRRSIKQKVTRVLGVDGYMFAGSQVSLMPHHIHFAPHQIINPDYFQMYFKNLARHSSRLIAMNTAVGVQRNDAYYSTLPLPPTWASLQSLVPTALNLGLIGYSVVNPGSVGGERFGDLHGPFGPEKFQRELYIRWLQVSIFMPVLQFSSPPGSENNDLEIIKLSKRLIKIRNDIVLPQLIKGLAETRELGITIIQPLHFVDPRASSDINDQFSVGEDIIVAPILKEGHRSRDIYLPSGWWNDEMAGQRVLGGKWIRNYSVPLEKVAFFTRITPTDSLLQPAAIDLNTNELPE